LSGSARVFVSYRRDDTRHVAGRLADRLVERFQVFMDMDTIEPGTDQEPAEMDFTTTEKGKKLSGGLLHCYEADGSATFAWTHDNLHIVSFASDSDLSFAAMKKWWEHAGSYRQP
jgi:hypothetical protein